jgi:hypothetical protein
LTGLNIRKCISDEVATFEIESMCLSSRQQQAWLRLSTGTVFLRRVRAAKNSIQATSLAFNFSLHPSIDLIDYMTWYNASVNNSLVRYDEHRNSR